MGRGIGDKQREIGLLLLGDHPMDVNELVKIIYKAPPTKTRQNTIWASMRGMAARRMIQETGGITMGGSRRWELTKQGREDFEALRKDSHRKPAAFAVVK